MTYLSKMILLLICSSVSLYGYSQSQNPISDTNTQCCAHCTCGSNNQPPLGIMTAHIHLKGKWMVSYSYMDMTMKGNRIGTAKANDNTVSQNYMMIPETMSMQMHMGMVMYGITDRLTIMGMAGYAVNNMSMTMKGMSMPGMVMPDMNMTSTSSGFADTKIFGLYNISHSDKQRIIISLGVNIPTGTIKALGTTMLGDNQRLPYNMQIGTGSAGIIPAITYTHVSGALFYGADAGADIKMSDNSLGYKLGNIYHATTWLGYRLLPFVSASVRAEGISSEKITGADPLMLNQLYAAYDPTTSTKNYGGKWINLYAGVNFHFNKPVVNNFSLLAEYGLPVYENLNGTQMSLHGNLLVGLQYAF